MSVDKAGLSSPDCNMIANFDNTKLQGIMVAYQKYRTNSYIKISKEGVIFCYMNDQRDEHDDALTRVRGERSEYIARSGCQVASLPSSCQTPKQRHRTRHAARYLHYNLRHLALPQQHVRSTLSDCFSDGHSCSGHDVCPYRYAEPILCLQQYQARHQGHIAKSSDYSLLPSHDSQPYQPYTNSDASRRRKLNKSRTEET